ncbi:tRNA (adenosine(37)-N6)-threonylcarbamoyltransferase complex ATPase subunit type 1 TsaE [Breznakiella homolactica]|uniref:tRNA threonylcarbamoyladenosine biosynthesis protein TsaE n=1 Tax=Breznakiella homolactica TaxID=2798577 RepID=A0A7T7XJW8_9SPIR|nr:tRNA (adenosine(37)-N6)-threonylcarbamoyltransferase complex ATPase subunit type 1 TsaE [Breznakiella homolactica]QQO07528.1 tRNA (adenosine(37)-N6)-threonylcarbamoyltransferase complex ATPase subunit type 1 TsaE [Breznakiella homolactica]
MILTEAADCLSDYISASPEETLRIGKKLAANLRPGSVVALRGGLGAGKTQLAKGIARGLGIRDEVTSPTYTIVSEYEGEIPLYHIDAYRLRGEDDFSAMGGEELIYGGGISIIEWSERIPGSIPEDAVVVEIEITGPRERKITISARGLPEIQ